MFASGFLSIVTFVKGGPNSIWVLTKRALSISAVVTFILNAYPFSFLVEFSIVAPVVFLLTALATGAHFDDRLQPLRVPLGCAQLAALLLLVASAIHGLRFSLGTVLSDQGIRQFLLPVLLSILAVPAAFVVGVLSGYQELFTRVSRANPKPFSFRFYCYLKLIDMFKFNIYAMRAALPSIAVPLLDMSSHDEMDALSNQYKANRDQAQHPTTDPTTDPTAVEAARHIRVPFFRNPVAAANKVLEMGLADTLAKGPAWRSNENHWCSLARLVTHHGKFLRLYDVNNDITCMQDSPSPLWIEKCRWMANVYNLDGEAETLKQFKSLCQHYLTLLEIPVPGSLFANLEGLRAGIVETAEASFSLERLSFNAGYGLSLEIITRTST